MSKHGIKCHADCCHQMECCPRGIVEHWQHFKYLRQFTDITFFNYYWHEFKSLIGLNNAKDDES